MALFLDLSHHFPMRWTRLFRRAQVLLDALVRSPAEHRLSWAIKRGNPERLAELLDASGWPLDKPLAPFKYERPTRLAHEGHTLLHLAVIRGHLGCVRVLAERGATVDVATRWGVTPSMMAASRADVSILAYLETQGADLTRRRPSTSTFVDDYVGPTVLEVFQSEAGETLEASKARLDAQAMEDVLPCAGSDSTRHRGRL